MPRSKINYHVDPSEVTNAAGTKRIQGDNLLRTVEATERIGAEAIETKLLSDERIAKNELTRSWDKLSKEYQVKLTDPEIYSNEEKMKAVHSEYQGQVEEFEKGLADRRLSNPVRDELITTTNSRKNSLEKFRMTKLNEYKYKQQVTAVSLRAHELSTNMKDIFANKIKNGNGFSSLDLKTQEEYSKEYGEKMEDLVRLGVMTESEAKEHTSNEYADIYELGLQMALQKIENSDMTLDKKEKAYNTLIEHSTFEGYDLSAKESNKQNKYVEPELMHKYLLEKNPYTDAKESLRRARQKARRNKKLVQNKYITVQEQNNLIDKRDIRKAVNNMYGDGQYTEAFGGKRWKIAYDNRLYGSSTKDMHDINSSVVAKVIDKQGLDEIKRNLAETGGHIANTEQLSNIVQIALSSADLNIQTADEENVVPFLKDAAMQSGVDPKLLYDQFMAMSQESHSANIADPNAKYTAMKAIDQSKEMIKERLDDTIRNNYNNDPKYKVVTNVDFLSRKLQNSDIANLDIRTKRAFLEENTARPVFVDSDGNPNMYVKNDIFYQSEVTQGSSSVGFLNFSKQDVEYFEKELNLTPGTRGHLENYFEGGALSLEAYNKNLAYLVTRETGNKTFTNDEVTEDMVIEAKRKTIQDFANKDKTKYGYRTRDEKDIQDAVDERNGYIKEENAKRLIEYNKQHTANEQGIMNSGTSEPNKYNDYKSVNGDPKNSRVFDAGRVATPTTSPSKLNDFSNAYSFIEKQEGYNGNTYKDQVGIPTVGYGFKVSDLPPQYKKLLKDQGGKLTREQSNKIFEELSQDRVKELKKLLGNTKTSQNQMDAMLSLIYNIGIGNFKKSSLLKKHLAGDYAGAANEFKKWNKAKGKVLPGLVNRREQEAYMYAGEPL